MIRIYSRLFGQSFLSWRLSGVSTREISDFKVVGGMTFFSCGIYRTYQKWLRRGDLSCSREIPPGLRTEISDLKSLQSLRPRLEGRNGSALLNVNSFSAKCHFHDQFGHYYDEKRNNGFFEAFNVSNAWVHRHCIYCFLVWLIHWHTSWNFISSLLNKVYFQLPVIPQDIPGVAAMEHIVKIPDPNE